MLNSTYNRAVIEAYNRGYKVVNGKVYNPNHNLVNGWVRKLKNKYNSKYYIHLFSIKVSKEVLQCPVHRLIAYQKFGNKIFEPGIQVRHLDGNPLNNLEDNIEIGTQSENMMDIPPEKRKAHSILATSYNRRFTDNEMEQIQQFHKKCHSYKKTKTKFNISSSGTLWEILNRKYQTKVPEVLKPP
jgi:hypothetical protein